MSADQVAEHMPSKIRLRTQYGFYDEHGEFRGWKEGDVVGDASLIKLLVERKAPYEVLA